MIWGLREELWSAVQWGATALIVDLVLFVAWLAVMP